MNKLSKKDIQLICEYLCDRAMQEADRGNLKKEKRIFELVEKLEYILDEELVDET